MISLGFKPILNYSKPHTFSKLCQETYNENFRVTLAMHILFFVVCWYAFYGVVTTLSAKQFLSMHMRPISRPDIFQRHGQKKIILERLTSIVGCNYDLLSLYNEQYHVCNGLYVSSMCLEKRLQHPWKQQHSLAKVRGVCSALTQRVNTV